MPALSTVQAWGIFDQVGNPIISTLAASVAVADSVATFDFLKEYRISDFPTEAGGFATYNKIRWPFDAKLTFTKGGSLNDRQKFLNAIDTLIGSLTLYTVSTPEKLYQSASLTHYDYRRTSENGVSLLAVDVWVREVILAPSPQFSNTKAPSGADPIQGGTVNTSTPTQQQQQMIQDAPDLTNPFS